MSKTTQTIKQTHPRQSLQRSTADSQGHSRDESYYLRHDYKNRTNPDLMNQLLLQAVPVLKNVDWKITDVNNGYCESLLPLNHATTNQHGTHQAALISLSADYTGGMALVTVLDEIPIAGIHPDSEDSASLWLASMDVKYIKPSTGHLIGRCEVPEELGQKLYNRYRNGKRILVTLDVFFESNGQTVAQAKMKYFAQPTAQLLDCSKSISPLFSAKQKASARMIAGVRASNSIAQSTNAGLTTLRVDCPYAEAAAGPHGALLAERLKLALPQLPLMVMARTSHIDELLHSVSDLEQVVMLGAGLDMRPFRYADKTAQKHLPHFFELDLAEMLEERNRVITKLNRSDVKRTSIVANFIHDDIGQLLREVDQFDPQKRTVFIYEGCSMYFNALVNATLVASVSDLMQHPESRFWTDFVSADVADGTVEHPAIKKFLQRMNELGEAFIFGVDKPSSLLLPNGFSAVQTQSVSDYLGQHKASEEVLTRYFFSVSSKDVEGANGTSNPVS